MSKRRSNPPRQSSGSRLDGNVRGPEGSGSGRRGFLERLRVQDREEAAEARSRSEKAGRSAGARRSRSRRRGRTQWTKFQLISLAIMVFLGLTVIGSTFIPYLSR